MFSVSYIIVKWSVIHIIDVSLPSSNQWMNKRIKSGAFRLLSESLRHAVFLP